jgi:hypothetical protein
LGEGSTFGFLLSFSKATETQYKKENLKLNREKEVQKIKVLVAEGIALNQMLIKIILADFGFECEIAKNSKIVIEKLKK